MKPDTPLTCREAAELGTAYLDGSLFALDRDRFESHGRDCPSCRAVLTELRLLVGAAGQLRSRAERPTDPGVLGAMRLFTDHGLHRDRPRVQDLPLGIGKHMAAVGDHIGYLWESEREFLSTAEFLAAGLQRDEACVLLGTDAANRRVLTSLENLGVNPSDLRRQDRLHVASPLSWGEEILGTLDDFVRTAVDRGLPGVRVLGNLGWGEPSCPTAEEFLKLEARVTGAIGRYPAVVVCSYEVGRVPARVLLKGGFECHPVILNRGTLRRNDAYVPGEQFLAELERLP